MAKKSFSLGSQCCVPANAFCMTAVSHSEEPFSIYSAPIRAHEDITSSPWALACSLWQLPNIELRVTSAFCSQAPFRAGRQHSNFFSPWGLLRSILFFAFGSDKFLSLRAALRHVTAFFLVNFRFLCTFSLPNHNPNMRQSCPHKIIPCEHNQTPTQQFAKMM